MSKQTLQLNINGMTCGHCENFVSTTVLELDGVISATADHKTGIATIIYDAAVISKEAIIAAINDTHYSVA